MAARAKLPSDGSFRCPLSPRLLRPWHKQGKESTMPDDTTPHGGEALHAPPERATIPEPKPGRGSDAPPQGLPRAASERPSLPRSSERMAADIEDEDADPVVESDPSVTEESGKPSVTRQPGG
jgi:hypothetical protein